MRIGDLQAGRNNRHIVTILSDNTVRQAASRMRDSGVGCLVVVNHAAEVCGIITERDIVFRVVADREHCDGMTVGQAMTPPPVATCDPESPLADVREIMSQRRIRHMPILRDGELVGMVSLRDVMTATLQADRDAGALAIYSMARLAEARDPETGAHLERTRELACILARALKSSGAFAGQIDEHFISLLHQTSALHDIGKVAVPDFVLLKPDRLTNEEFEVMKSHTVHGAETLDYALQRFPDAIFLRMARDIAASHHERYDGKGYPAGLAGENIPLSARIFAVVDVYDALVTKRVYKEAFSHELASSIILDADGTQFDPAVIQAFLQCRGDFRSISLRYAQKARLPAEQIPDGLAISSGAHMGSERS